MRHTTESLTKLLQARFPGIALGGDSPSILGRFDPSSVARYLCGVAGADASVGAIHNYVWAMALTPRAAGADQALRNLAGLIPSDSVERT